MQEFLYLFGNFFCVHCFSLLNIYSKSAPPEGYNRQISESSPHNFGAKNPKKKGNYKNKKGEVSRQNDPFFPMSERSIIQIAEKMCQNTPLYTLVGAEKKTFCCDGSFCHLKTFENIVKI